MTSAKTDAARLLPLLDLTSLGEDDDRARIEALCDAACTPYGAPAALCVYPEWIATCRERLHDLGLNHDLRAPRLRVAGIQRDQPRILNPAIRILKGALELVL